MIRVDESRSSGDRPKHVVWPGLRRQSRDPCALARARRSHRLISRSRRARHLPDYRFCRLSAMTTAFTDARIAQGTLFEPLRLGRYELPHRILMAPLTRSRARQPGNVPTPLMAWYYAQRASAALIISEATQVSMQGQGYAWTPGIHSRDQTEGWRVVTEAVHQCGRRIFLQLWHVGRISHPALQPDGMLPVAPSAIRPAVEAFIANERREPEMVQIGRAHV